VSGTKLALHTTQFLYVVQQFTTDVLTSVADRGPLADIIYSHTFAYNAEHNRLHAFIQSTSIVDCTKASKWFCSEFYVNHIQTNSLNVSNNT